MKRIVFVFLFLVLALSACASPTPVVITVIPTAEPVLATDVPAPTDEPAATEAPEPTDEPVATEAPEPTDEEPGVEPTNTKPPAVGGAVFTDLTRNVDAFSLRCSPSEVIFTVKSINKAITGVTLYYRVTEKDTTAARGLITGPEMVGDKKGNFTLTFSALNVKDDLRLANGWFDYQFVGVNKFGDVVGRSDIITKEVTFTLDCP